MTSRSRFFLCLAVIAWLVAGVPAWPATAGSLIGSSDSSNLLRDLTAEGGIDWVYWGTSTPERKSGGGSQISSLTTLNPGQGILTRPDTRQLLTWSDGTTIPINRAINATGGNNATGIGIGGGQGNGFSFTAPADATGRTLIVHVGGNNTGGLLTAHLSDGSAPDFGDVVPRTTNAWDRNYMLTYNAAGAGQTITVTWTMQSGLGTGLDSSVWVAGAALSPAGSPFYFLGRVPLAGGPTSLAVNGNIVYGCDLLKVLVVDASDPANLAAAGTAAAAAPYNNNNTLHCAMFRNSLVEFTDTNGIGGAFQYFDLTNPRAPQAKTGTKTNKTFPEAPAFIGNTAFLPTLSNKIFGGNVIDQWGDLVAFDLTNLDKPTVVGTLEKQRDPIVGGAYNVFGVAAVNNQTLYVATTGSTGDVSKGGNDGPGQLLVVDATNPAAMSVVKTLSIPGTVHMFRPMIQGNVAVAVGDSAGWSGTSLSGNLVVVTLDITNPRNPVVLSTVTTTNVIMSWTLHAMAAIGNNLFLVTARDVTKNNTVLMQVDASDPAHPKIANFLIPDGSVALAVSGSVLYVAPEPYYYNGLDAFSLPKPISGGSSGGVCTFTLGATSYSAAATAGQSTVSVTTQTGCAWTGAVQGNATSWLHVTSGATGSGNGAVAFSFDANAGAARLGTILIGGQTFTVNQAAAAPVCSYSLSTTSYAAAAAAGQSTVDVTTQTGCAWTAAVQGSVTWLHVTSGASGSGSGRVSFSFDANNGAARPGTMLIAGQTFTVNQAAATPSGPAPTLAAGGVVNAADYTANFAPGMIVSIFGSNFATATAGAASIPLPNSLSGASVEIVDGSQVLNAPLFFVSAGQINAQLPFNTTSPNVQVRVRSAQGVSNTQTINMATRSPRLFTQSMDGNGDAIVVHADYSVVTAQSPASPGEAVILFLTGLGAVSPSIAAGQAGGDGSAGKPLNQVSQPVTVTVGGTSTTIYFAGLAPNFVGLYQINFQVPNNPSYGSKTIAVSVSNQSSQNTATLWVGMKQTAVGSGSIGPAGGTVSAGSTSITVPAGILTSPAQIAITKSTGATAFDRDRVSDVYTATGVPIALDSPLTLAIDLPSPPPNPDEVFTVVQIGGEGAPPVLVKAQVTGSRVTATFPATSIALGAAITKGTERNSAPGLVYQEAKILYFVVARWRIGSVTPSGHFVVTSYTALASDKILGFLENAYAAAQTAGLLAGAPHGSQGPISVFIVPAELREPWGQILQVGGNVIEISEDLVTGAVPADQPKLTHMFMHYVLNTWDPRLPVADVAPRSEPWTWLDEAVATWSERVFDLNYVPSQALQNDDFLMQHGLEYPVPLTSSATPARNHGYGASMFLEYVLTLENLFPARDAVSRMKLIAPLLKDRGAGTTTGFQYLPVEALQLSAPVSEGWDKFSVNYNIGSNVYDSQSGLSTMTAPNDKSWRQYVDAGLTAGHTATLDPAGASSYTDSWDAPDLMTRFYLIQFTGSWRQAAPDVTVTLSNINGSAANAYVYMVPQDDSDLSLVGPVASGGSLSTAKSAFAKSGKHLLIMLVNSRAVKPFDTLSRLTLTVQAQGGTQPPPPPSSGNGPKYFTLLWAVPPPNDGALQVKNLQPVNWQGSSFSMSAAPVWSNTNYWVAYNISGSLSSDFRTLTAGSFEITRHNLGSLTADRVKIAVSGLACTGSLDTYGIDCSAGPDQLRAGALTSFTYQILDMQGNQKSAATTPIWSEASSWGLDITLSNSALN